MPVEPRQDDAIIEEARECVAVIERNQLKLGRLALEFAPIGDASHKTGAYERLALLASKIGADEGTLRNYRAVAWAWTELEAAVDQRGEELSFSILKALAPVGDKRKALQLLQGQRWTVPTAKQLMYDEGLMRKPRSRRPKEVLNKLREVTATMKLLDIDISDISEADRRVYAAALDDVEAQVTRLRLELIPTQEAQRD